MSWGVFDKIKKESERFIDHGGISIGGKSGTDMLMDAKDDITGKTGEEAAKKAASTQAEAMTQQLDYLKEINRLPQEYKEQALTRLNDIFSGGPGAQEAQQQMIDQAKASPYYQAMMGGQQAGEEGVMRNAAQTGGLRSGNVQSALYDYNTQLQNQALSGAYGQQLQGLQGLAGLGTNEQQIGQTMGDIGATNAAGILGAAQSRQAGTANMMNLGLGLGSLGLGFAKL